MYYAMLRQVHERWRENTATFPGTKRPADGRRKSRPLGYLDARSPKVNNLVYNIKSHISFIEFDGTILIEKTGKPFSSDRALPLHGQKCYRPVKCLGTIEWHVWRHNNRIAFSIGSSGLQRVQIGLEAIALGHRCNRRAQRLSIILYSCLNFGSTLQGKSALTKLFYQSHLQVSESEAGQN